MKKILFLLLILAVASFAATTATPSLAISVSNISETIRPGSSFVVQVQVVNNGQQTADEVTVTPELKNPFRIKTGTSSSIQVGNIGLGQTGTAKFHIYALPDTPADVYEIAFVTQYKAKAKVFSIPRAVSISVEATPLLEIIKAKYDELHPGDFAELALTIQNIGNGDARNIRVIYANSSSQIRPAGSTVAYLSSLPSGKSQTVKIPMAIAGDAEGGTYSVGIGIDYDDLDGTPQKSLSRTIGVKVDSNIELKAFLDSGTVVQNKPSEVVISIANTGPNTALFLELVPVDSSGMEISPGSIYIGNLESDDFDTAEFTVKSSSAGKQQLLIDLVYKDQFNQEQKTTRNVELNIITEDDAAALEKQTSPLTYLLAAIVLAGIYWYWRKRKKQE